MFSAGAKPRDVAVVAERDQSSDEDGEQKEGKLLDEGIPPKPEGEEQVAKREGEGGEDGCQGNVSPDEEDDEPDDERDDGGEGVVREESENDAGGSGDAFAAFQAEIDGKHMAEDGGEADKEPEEVSLPTEGGGVEDEASQNHGEEGLEQVECEDECEEPATEQAGDIGGTDVFRAGGAGVDAVGKADEQAEGYGPDQVGGGDQIDQQSSWRGHGCDIVTDFGGVVLFL